MAKRGFEDFHPVIVKCSILITSLAHRSFRVKDVLFHMSLVKEVFRSSNHFQDFHMQAVQVIRLFDKYKLKGWALVIDEGAQKVFELTRLGVFETFASLLRLDYVLPTSEAIFLQSYIDSYGQHIQAFIDKDLKEEQRRELAEWLKPAYIYKQQLRAVEAGIRDLTLRISDSQNLQRFVKAGQAKGLGHRQVIESLPSDFSYRLSHQKRLKEWLLELSDEMQAYELEKGIALREKNLYAPSLQHLETLKSLYLSLQQTA